mmetsp:Transcript_20522/g.32139  ORF Transcript_20522/g.32139 Transcript_20522/m.32139 type:complete len:103 (-) Transcript_20522:235-543(-)
MRYTSPNTRNVNPSLSRRSLAQTSLLQSNGTISALPLLIVLDFSSFLPSTDKTSCHGAVMVAISISVERNRRGALLQRSNHWPRQTQLSSSAKCMAEVYHAD